MLKIFTLMGAIAASAIGSIGAVYMKRASAKFSLRLKSLWNINLFWGLFLYFISSVLVLYLLKFNDVSYVYPLTALTYVFIIFLSWFMLNEKINMYNIASVALITSGVLLIVLS